jgi:hypothetical protein
MEGILFYDLTVTRTFLYSPGYVTMPKWTDSKDFAPNTHFPTFK